MPGTKSVLPAVAVSLAAVLVFSFFVYKDRERRLRLAAEAKLVATLQQNEELGVRLAGALDERREMEARLREAEMKLAELSGKLVAVNEEMDELRRDADRVKTDYERVLREKQLLEDQLRGRDEHIRGLLSDLNNRVPPAPVKTGVDLGNVVVTGSERGESPAAPAQTASAGAETDGEVIAVNSEFDFLVINLGRRHGVGKGSRFSVSRAGRAIAQGEVEMSQDNISAASLSGSAAGKIRIGDQIRLQS